MKAMFKSLNELFKAIERFDPHSQQNIEEKKADFHEVLACYWEVRAYKDVIFLLCDDKLKKMLILLESYFHEPCNCNRSWCMTQQALEFYEYRTKESHDIIN